MAPDTLIGYVAVDRADTRVIRGGYRGKVYKTPAYARAAKRRYMETDEAFALRMKVVPVHMVDDNAVVMKTIDPSLYTCLDIDQLLDDAIMLRELRAHGVDNWEGYADAQAAFNKGMGIEED